MYTIRVEASEYFDSAKSEFVEIPGATLDLEHSLLSISKWESKWKRPFLSETKGPKTTEEWLDYIRCMTLNKNVNPLVYRGITGAQLQGIVGYIGDTMTATWFNENKRGKRPPKSNSEITSEVIYWQMCQWNIPFECQKWHLNRLMTLIRVCNEKGEPPQKMSQNDVLKQYASVNAARRKARKH